MKHIKLRSFPTKCRYCGKPLLYWESTRGAKVFFNLPIYGKPVQHHCPNRNSKKKYPIVKETAGDHRRKIFERETFQCPVCGKIYSTQAALDNHFSQLKKYDDKHAEFSEMIEFINFESEPNQSHGDGFKTRHPLDTVQDRFLLKTKSSEVKSKFEKLIRRK